MAEITMENVNLVFRSTLRPQHPEPTEPDSPGEIDPALAKIRLLEDRFVALAETILTNVPRCADRSAVLRQLREAKMTAVDSVAKGGLI